MEKLPAHWRPFARRRAIAEAESTRRILEGLRLQRFLWELSEHGQRSIPLGVITRQGYQGGMDAELAAYLQRQQ